MASLDSLYVQWEQRIEHGLLASSDNPAGEFTGMARGVTKPVSRRPTRFTGPKIGVIMQDLKTGQRHIIRNRKRRKNYRRKKKINSKESSTRTPLLYTDCTELRAMRHRNRYSGNRIG